MPDVHTSIDGVVDDVGELVVVARLVRLARDDPNHVEGQRLLPEEGGGSVEEPTGYAVVARRMVGIRAGCR